MENFMYRILKGVHVSLEARIVDTTLRDGEQKPGLALSMQDKIEIAKDIDKIGVYQIESGTAAMGGEEKKSIEKIVSLGLKSKISSWNRMNTSDIQHSIDCRVDIIHISVPTSDIQINSKLCKDKEWVMYNMEKNIAFAKERDFEVTIGFEDASRADILFLIKLSQMAVNLGVKRVRYADTVGILYPRKVYNIIKELKQSVSVEIEIHTHNDFGMAIANSVAAVQSGAEYVDCTIGGIGERAGNCDYLKFLKVCNGLGISNVDIRNLAKIEESIKNLDT
jgi:homocitrate synthase NifV